MLGTRPEHSLSPIAAAGDRGELARLAVEAAAGWFAGRRSAATREAYAGDIAQLGRYLLANENAARELAHARAAEAGPADLPGWRDAQIGAGLRPATIARRISAARSFFRYLRAAGYRHDDPGAGVEVPRVSPELQAAPHVEASDVRAILRAVERGRLARTATRNRAIVRLGAEIGLRCAELCGLRVADFDAKAGTVRVEGKGGRVRILDTGDVLAGELAELVAGRPLDARIFPISTRRVRQLAHLWGERAGVQLTPHALRRTFATVYLDRGGSLESLRRALGHSDPRTTARYDRRRTATARVDYGEG